MDKLAEKLARWFGSTTFIVMHAFWFVIWVLLHFTARLDPDWSALTIIVSLEAIFLSLFILRAENIQATRFEKDVKRDLKTSRKILHEVKRTKKEHNWFSK